MIEEVSRSRVATNASNQDQPAAGGSAEAFQSSSSKTISFSLARTDQVYLYLCVQHSMVGCFIAMENSIFFRLMEKLEASEKKKEPNPEAVEIYRAFLLPTSSAM